MNEYYNWQAMRELLGMKDMMLYSPPEMIYMDSLSQDAQQRRQQNSNSWQDMLKSGSTVSSGMTPNAVNAKGESFYGWGSKTGDWGAGSAVPFDGSQYGVGQWGAQAGDWGAGASVPFDASQYGAGASSSSYGYVAPVLAAIAGQHMMSGSTDRRVGDSGNLSKSSGHRTGDVFSGDFFTEPWMAYAQQQLGVDTPTAGEKTDAAIDRIQDGKGGFSDFASTVPGTAYQWFDPVGDFAGNFMSDKFGGWGKAVTTAVLPHTGLKWFGNWLGDLF